MKPDAFLHRYSAPLFAVFFLFVLVAFWPRYFSHPFNQQEVRFHTHGIALTLWCLLLITQAFLIRTNRRPLHRQLGKISYVLVPIMLVTTVNLLHFRTRAAGHVTNIEYNAVALVLNALVVFAVCYGMAIYHRRTPTLHARYMVCTVFPMVTPVTDRLIHLHARSLFALVPSLDGDPMVPLIGFAMADLVLVGLILWDWRANRRLDVFPFVLIILLMYHISYATFHLIPAWRTFCNWFLSMPFS